MGVGRKRNVPGERWWEHLETSLDIRSTWRGDLLNQLLSFTTGNKIYLASRHSRQHVPVRLENVGSQEICLLSPFLTLSSGKPYPLNPLMGPAEIFQGFRDSAEAKLVRGFT